MKYIIKCPNCGWEYLPGEIYLPNQFLGRPKDVERTLDGKILMNYGTNMDLEESFECENCKCAFKVFANVDFTTGKDVLRDFEEDYVVEMFPNRIVLEEQ